MLGYRAGVVVIHVLTLNPHQRSATLRHFGQTASRGGRHPYREAGSLWPDNHKGLQGFSNISWASKSVYLAATQYSVQGTSRLPVLFCC